MIRSLDSGKQTVDDVTLSQMNGQGLKIRLFGSLQITQHGQLLPLRSRKAASLLALLLLRTGREAQREWLAATLWPDDEIENRQANLRQRLADLRRALGLDKTRLQSPSARTLRFDATGIEIDVLEFDRAVARGDFESLKAAAKLYAGPLLEDSSELWVMGEREQRQHLYLKALESMAQHALTAGDKATAIEVLQRGVGVDPWYQSLHRLLMQIHAQQEDFDSALRVYSELAEVLHRQHNAMPEHETRQICQELRAKAHRISSNSPVSGRSGPVKRYQSVCRTDDTASMRGAESSAPTGQTCNVPVPLAPLIGRERELREIQARLLTARLLTLTGIGGSGKTRLAVEAGRELLHEFPEGVYFADLSGLSDPNQVPQAVSAALDSPVLRGKTWLEALQEHIHSRHLLLIVDNCEHIQQACLECIQSLLRTCDNLRILATSRHALGLIGEYVLLVAPLAVPKSEAIAVDALATYESIQFFLERARAAYSNFAMTSQNAPAVARLCRMLDGLPLALELAAALTAILTVEEISEYLEQNRLKVEHTDPTVPARHRSLEAMLKWSYHLLLPVEQRYFARMSVFAGGCTRHAVEEICSDVEPVCPDVSLERIHLRPSVGKYGTDNGKVGSMQMLAGLVSKSLVVADQREGRTRYRLLETVRAFAAEKLASNGEALSLRERFLTFYFEMARDAETGLTGPQQAAWIDRLEEEHVNLGAALRMRDTPEMELTALRLANSLGRFWQVRGYFSEGRETLGRLLAATDADSAMRERADAMNWAGILAVYQSDYEAAYRYCREASEIWEALDDMKGLGGALGGLGMIAKDTGDLQGARRMFEDGLQASRQAGDRLGEAGSLGYLGIVSASLGDAETARTCYEASLALRRELQDHWGIAASLNNLALLARECRQNETARTLIEESIAIRRELQDRRSLAISLNVLGEILCEAGRLETAQSHFIESLCLCRELGDRRSIAFSLEHFALLAMNRQQWEDAARLHGAADKLRERINAPLSPGNRAQRDGLREKLMGSLTEGQYHTAYTSGQNMEIEPLLEEIGSKS